MTTQEHSRSEVGRANTQPVVIVGAGPYGLSIAAHLRARGVPFRIFGDAMSSWRHAMPAGMQLKSAPAASSISAAGGAGSINEFRAATGDPKYVDGDVVAIESFIDYGDWFVANQRLEVDPTKVARISRLGGALAVETTEGEEIRPPAVVVATGHLGHVYVPDELRALGTAVTHTSEETRFDRFAGARVAVVGAGQSALESAALLAEAGASPTLICRAPTVLWGGSPGTPRLIDRMRAPEGALGTGWGLQMIERGPRVIRRMPTSSRALLLRRTLGPRGAWWLRDRVEGRVPIHTNARIMSAVAGPGGVELSVRSGADGAMQRICVDHVLAGTGYHYDVRATGLFDDVTLRSIVHARGFPRLQPGFASSVPGLYFAGLAAAGTFGPLLRFVAGTQWSSPRMAQSITARVAAHAS